MFARSYSRLLGIYLDFFGGFRAAGACFQGALLCLYGGIMLAAVIISLNEQAYHPTNLCVLDEIRKCAAYKRCWNLSSEVTEPIRKIGIAWGCAAHSVQSVDAGDYEVVKVDIDVVECEGSSFKLTFGRLSDTKKGRLGYQEYLYIQVVATVKLEHLGKYLEPLQ